MNLRHARISLRKGARGDPAYNGCWILSWSSDDGGVVELRITRRDPIIQHAFLVRRELCDDRWVLPAMEIERRIEQASQQADDRGAYEFDSEKECEKYISEELLAAMNPDVLAAIEEMKIRWQCLERIVSPSEP